MTNGPQTTVGAAGSGAPSGPGASSGASDRPRAEGQDAPTTVGGQGARPTVSRAGAAPPGTSAGTTAAGRPTRPADDPLRRPNTAQDARVEADRRRTPVARPVGPRRAHLQLRRLHPWSVFKFSLAFSLCLVVVFVTAIAVLYGVLSGTGVFGSINSTVQDLTSSSTDGTGGVSGVLRARTVIGGAFVLGLVNAVLMTFLATVGSFIYNLCADLMGGIEVTLSERD